MLSKEECLFERDEEGKLLGKSVTLELLESKPEVIIKPLSRGKLMRIYNKAKIGTPEEQEESDTEIISNGLIEPILTKEEIISLRPQYANAITTAILSVSLGKDQKEIVPETVLSVEESTLKK